MSLTSTFLLSDLCLFLNMTLYVASENFVLSGLLFLLSAFIGSLYYLCGTGIGVTVLVLGLAHFQGRTPYFRTWLDAGAAHNRPQYRNVVALLVLILILL